MEGITFTTREAVAAEAVIQDVSSLKKFCLQIVVGLATEQRCKTSLMQATPSFQRCPYAEWAAQHVLTYVPHGKEPNTTLESVGGTLEDQPDIKYIDLLNGKLMWRIIKKLDLESALKASRTDKRFRRHVLKLIRFASYFKWPGVIPATYNCKDYEAFKIAVETGAGHDDYMFEGRPLAMAVRQGQVHIAKDLLDHGAVIEIPNYMSDNPSMLQDAVESGNTEMVKLLLSHDADVNASDKRGWTPLECAAVSQEPEMVKMLAAAGADSEYACTSDGESIIIAAAYPGNEEAMKELFRRGAHFGPPRDWLTDAGFEEPYNWKICDLADDPESLEMLRMCLENGGDASAKGFEGCTALAAAARRGDVDAVKLLQHGADVDGVDEHGERAINLAMQKGHHQVAQVLREAGAREGVMLSVVGSTN